MPTFISNWLASLVGKLLQDDIKEYGYEQIRAMPAYTVCPGCHHSVLDGEKRCPVCLTKVRR